MAVTANQVVKRQDGCRSRYRVAASTRIYEGTLVFLASGYADDDTASGANEFAGVAIAEVDNSSGSAGDLDVECWIDGVFDLTGSGFSQGNVGARIYATDNYTISTTATGNSVVIGECVEFVSSTVLRVKLDVNLTEGVVTDSATLQAITFNGATGANTITVPTNLADALSILDSAADIIVLDTTTGTPAVTVTPISTFTGALTATGGITLPDNANITLGTGSDITIDFDATNLVIATAVADTGAVALGADGAGVDVIFYGDTASENITWDQSADDLIMTAAVRIVGQGSTIVPVTPAAAQQTLAAGGGAVTITEFYTSGATDAGGDAWTLADGAQVGQLKKIQLTTDGGGDATLTPTNLSGGTTITFADVGDYCLLIWDGSNWVALELGNDADGTTAPVLA